ncbi:MAG: TonB-dependent copper receptor [Gallionellales bacterium GWA2_60_142]|nr:MAG: TonB-dependent copper receptor [Gallionellales bacterium GWA2_60_142]HCI12975.1 TonB-dependent copper receptor [Gallionellaceae bacterium]
MQFKRITLCVALAAAPNAFAAETATLDEVVVTAPAMEQPLVVTTDPRKPRQPVPAHDGADYLKTIPGFSVIRKGGTDGDPVLRGMAGSRLNILLDGEHILGGCGNRMDPPTAYVFPSSYDKITVLKGPQTVLHGPGNSAGTVLFEREIKRAEQVGTRFKGALTLGSFGRNDEMLDVSSGSEQVYAQGTLTRSDANDYSDGNGQAVHSSYTRWSGNAAFGYTPDDNTRVELTAAKSDGKAAYADRAMDGVKFARDNVGLKFEKRRMGGTLDSIETQLYYNYVDHVMDNYSLRTQAGMKMVSNPDRETAGARAVAGLSLSDATYAKVGVDYQSNKHTLRSTMNQATTPYELLPRAEDANFRNYGLFGEMTHDMAEDSRVIGGLRMDNWHAEDRRAAMLAARDANNVMYMVANPTSGQSRDKTLSSGFARYERDYDASTFYAGIGHTQRFPDYWELLSANKESLTSTSAFNTNPEKTTQLDIGTIYKAGQWSASVSGFYSKVNDFILIESGVAKAGPVRTITVTRNVNATTWGAEAGLAYQLASDWKLDGSLAYVHGTNDTDGVALGQMPPLEGRVGATYDNRVWSVGGLLRMASAQDRFAVNQGNIVGQDIGRTGGFGVFSLNGAYRVGKSAQISAGIDNLFDKNYAEHISRRGSAVTGFTTTARINEVGRNLWVKANVEF